MAVDGTKVAVLVGPFIPDGYAVLLEVLYVGVPGDEPQEFIDDGLEVHLLGGKQRESVRKVESHLIAEYALGACSGTVFFHDAVGADVS